MRVLGIDPGLGITGYGVLDSRGDQLMVVEAGVVQASGKQPMPSRLLNLSDELDNILRQFRPEAVAIEELYSHYGHPRTAIIMGHARGVILLEAAQAGVPVFPYSATRIKKSLTGNGRATKQQMQRMICVTLHLDTLPEPPDIADALAVALCHTRAVGHTAGVIA